MTKNIYHRMLDVMREVSYIQKEDKKVNDQYKFVGHDAVASKVREALIKHEVAFEERILEKSLELKEVTETILAWDKSAGAKLPVLDKEGKPLEKIVTGYVCTIFMEFTFINPDAPEEKMVAQGYGMGLDTQDKATGKAMSYAKKYALLNALLLETGDDPEKDVHVNVSPYSGKKPEGMTSAQLKSKFVEIKNELEASADLKTLTAVWVDYQPDLKLIKEFDQQSYDNLERIKNDAKKLYGKA